VFHAGVEVSGSEVGVRPTTRSIERSACAVLVVDDNEDAASSLGVCLELAGFPIRIAHCGSDAMQALEAFQPTVALLDIGLPDIDGYHLAAVIRRRDQRVVLVALTGWGGDGDVAHAFHAGFDHHFTKPAEPGDLVALLDKCCVPDPRVRVARQVMRPRC
jgi:DNA-binding response OmpR family regulator